MTDTSPLVSICMITYNHEKFISEAIEGVLMQKTNFPIELVIGEDCSTDNTRSICIEYQKKYPDLIRLLLPDKNLGMHSNFIATLKACKGKYIAVCEGDDYWTDSSKLQKQVDFLESNPEYVACCHNVIVIDEIQNQRYQMWTWNDYNDISIVELALGNKISTLSICYRNYKEIINKISFFFENHYDVPVGDYILNIFLAQKGKIRYFPHKMGIYRINSQGICSSTSLDINLRENFLSQWIKMLLILKKYLDNETNRYIKIQLTHMADYLRFIYYSNNKKKEAFLISILLLKHIKYWDKSKIRLILSILYRTTFLFFKKT